MANQKGVPPAAPSAQPAPAKAAARRRRRWPWILAALVALGLVVILLLPTILSTGPFRRIALGQVNERINGKVEVESWSLGWFSGFQLNGIRVSDAQGQTVAEVKSVTLPAAVPALLRSRKEIGTLEIEGLKADIVLYPDGTNNLAKLIKQTGPPAPAKEAQPLGFDLVGAIAVRNGVITVHPALPPGGGQAGEAKPFLVSGLNADVKVASLEKPIQLDVKAALGEERAPLTVTGSATVLHNGKADPSSFEAEVAVKLAGLELAPLSALARQYGAPIGATGNLTATLSAQVKGQNSVAAQGDVSVKQLSLSGGPLGEDQPQLDHVGLGFDVAKTDRMLTIKRFQLDSPMCSASVSGTLEPQAAGNLPKGSLTAHAELELPALAEQLDGTLRLRKGLKVESGKFTLDSTLASDEKGQRLDGALRVENLAAVLADRRISLEAPISLTLHASQTEKGARLDNLELTSSFVSAHGGGTLEQFDLEGDSDLEAVMHEAGKFVDLSGKTAKGRAHLALHVSGPDPRMKNISGALTLTGLAVTGFTPGPVQLDGANATLAATALLDEKGEFQKISGLKCDFAAAKIADGTITLDSIAVAPGQTLPAFTNANGTLNVNLVEAARFARGMNLMPATIGLSGKLSCSAGLAVEKYAVRLNQIVATITDLDVSQGERHVREPKVTLTGAAEVSPAGRTAGIHGLAFQIAAGAMTLESLDVPDWAAAPAGITATLKGELDLERLLVSLKDFAPLPEGRKVTGQAVFTLKATTASATQKVNVQAALNALKVVSGTGQVVQEDKFTLDAAAVIAPSAASVSVDSMTVASSLFTLTAKGALTDWSVSQNLTADGTLACNWDRIGPFAAAFSGQQIEMSGKDSRKFHIRTALGAKDLRAILGETDAAAGLQVARLKVTGVEMTALSVPITIKDNVPSAQIEAVVNGGKLLVPARIDWSKLLPELVLPPDTVVLKDVKLTSEMADLGLSRVSPIFKGCTAAGGTVSLDSHLLDVQLSRAANVGRSILQRAVFEGGLSFSNVSMQCTGLLQSVVALCGGATGGAQLLSLPDQRVALALRNGRIIQGPMEIAAGSYRFKVSGSAGLADKTLDMVVELPVTRAMLGGRDDLYQLLKGEVITVPVKGTTDQPEIAKDAFADNLQRLVTAAGKKLIEQKGAGLLQKGLQNLFK